VKNAVRLLLVLCATWLLWSGHYTGLLIGLGALSCLGVVALVGRMRILDDEALPLRLAWRAARYLPWLLWQIVLANLDVARRILDPRLPIQPHLLRLPAGQRSELGRVIYANSITLTPGTVTVTIEGGAFTVHALSRAAAEDLRGGEMDRRVREVEGSA
jgi:multicomponent Na+:H+ antiporter subunit E